MNTQTAGYMEMNLQYKLKVGKRMKNVFNKKEKE